MDDQGVFVADLAGRAGISALLHAAAPIEAGFTGDLHDGDYPDDAASRGHGMGQPASDRGGATSGHDADAIAWIGPAEHAGAGLLLARRTFAADGPVRHS